MDFLRSSIFLWGLVLAGTAVAAHPGESPAGASDAPVSQMDAVPVKAGTSSTNEALFSAKQKVIRDMRDATLARLFKAKPETKEEISQAAGYGVFDAAQTNVILLVTGKGSGIVVDNAEGKETFMKMTRLGTGPGLGRKKFKQVLVFKSKALLEQFVSVGADVNASADMVLKPAESAGGLVLNGVGSLNPQLTVYQLTDRGILLQANWGGVGYLPDTELNGNGQ